MMMTRVLVCFAEARTVDVRIDVDLSLLLGSPQRYYEIATEAPDKQQVEIAALVPRIVDNLQLFVGHQRLLLEFRSFTAARARRAEFLVASLS